MPDPATLAALEALTKGVFTYLGSQAAKAAFPERKLKTALGRDPQQLAFQVALVQTYTEFARVYPQWTKSFFSEPFLEGPAAPLLARCLTRDGAPDPSELASVWADHLGLQGAPRERQLRRFLLPMASCFLRWLEAELHARPEFQPLLDSQALDEIAENTDQMAQAVERLRQELTTALAEAAKYDITIEQAQGPVVGEHNVVIQYFTNGIPDLPHGYAGRIRRFLDAYLGSIEHPVPFAGREAELSALDRWLDDPTASPYLLLLAPAGRGKSALLAEWSQRLASRHDLAIAFIPVSVRFRTNLSSVVFAAIVARLSNLFGEPLPIGANDPEQWRDLVLSYLSRPLPDGRRLLLILDGIDEAADWEPGPDLFPLNPPASVRIALATREVADVPDARSWFQLLGWERSGLGGHLSLDQLDQDGIAAVLAFADVPTQPGEPSMDLAGELHHLSGGEPLLVRLYVEHLSSDIGEGRKPQIETLSAIPPGLSGYFELWWHDQRQLWGQDAPLKERHVQIVLSLLACAKGPLRLDDMQQLAPDDAVLSSFAIREAIEHLRRFITGDAETGYAFSHPKLGEFFASRLSAAEREAFEDRVLAWGMTVVAALDQRSMSPEGISPYLVQFLGAHLERATVDPTNLLRLVSVRWQQAWEALDGTFTGFLGDVARAWQIAQGKNAQATTTGAHPPLLAAEVLCALSQSSCVSLAEAIPDVMVAALVEKQLWTVQQALSYVHRMSDGMNRAFALKRLAPHMDEAMLQQALASATTSSDEQWQAVVLEGLAPYLTPRHLASALAIARSIRSKSLRVRSLAALLPLLPMADRQDLAEEALDAFQTIEDHSFEGHYEWFSLLNSTRDDALPQLIACLDEPAACAQLESLRTKAWFKESELVAEMIGLLADRMSGEQRVKALDDALQIARATPVSLFRARLLAMLARFFPEHLQEPLLAEALTAWHEGIGPGRPEVWEVLDVLSSKLSHDLLLASLDIVRSTTGMEEASRAKGLQIVAQYLPDPLKHQMLTEALARTQTVEEGISKYLQISSIARDVAHAGYPEEAVAIVDEIPNDVLRVDSLSYLAPYLDPSRLRALLPKIRQTHDEAFRVRALGELATQVGGQAAVRIFNQALAVAGQVWRRPDRDHALANLITQIGAAVSPAEALRLSSLLLDVLMRAQVISKIAEQLPATERALALEWAVGVATRHGMTGEILINHVDQSEYLDQLLTSLESQPPLSSLSSYLDRVVPVTNSDQLARAMSLIEREQAGSIRATLMATLYQRLDPEQRRTVLTQERHLARSLADPQERSASLLALAAVAADTEQEELLDEALAAADGIEGAFQRVLSLLRIAAVHGHQRPNPAAEHALIIAQSMLSGRERVHALVNLSPYFSNLIELRDLLSDLAQLADARTQADYLVQLARHYPEQSLPALYQVARAVPIAADRGRALVELLPILPEQLREEALDRALDSIASVDFYLNRRRLIEQVSPFVAQLEPAQLYDVWSKLLRSFAQRPRRDLVEDLAALAPIAAQLGGSDLLVGIAEVIIETGDWWP